MRSSICMPHIIKQIAQQQQQSITNQNFHELDNLDNTTLL